MRKTKEKAGIVTIGTVVKKRENALAGMFVIRFRRIP